MSWPIWFGLRYLRAHKRNRFVSFAAASSVIGLALGVAAVITVLSVMNGFGNALRQRILGAVPHVVVTVAAEARATAMQRISAMPAVAAVTDFHEAQALIARGGGLTGVALFGIDVSRERSASNIAASMRDAPIEAMPAGHIVLGTPLAQALGLARGDRVSLIVPVTDGVGGVRTRMLGFVLYDTFELDAEVDYSVALVQHADLVTAGLTPTGTANLRVTLHDALRAPASAPAVAIAAAGSSAIERGETRGQERGASPVRVSDWSGRYGELFRAIAMEKVIMGALLMLVIALAAFNIVSSLAMLVEEKRSDIAVLRTLGASRKRIAGIFVANATLIAVAGTAAGVLLGIALSRNIGAVVAFIESVTGTSVLAGTYFVGFLSETQSGDVVSVVTIAIVVSLLAAMQPARRAARLDPVVALHRG